MRYQSTATKFEYQLSVGVRLLATRNTLFSFFQTILVCQEGPWDRAVTTGLPYVGAAGHALQLQRMLAAVRALMLPPCRIPPPLPAARRPTHRLKSGLVLIRLDP